MLKFNIYKWFLKNSTNAEKNNYLNMVNKTYINGNGSIVYMERQKAHNSPFNIKGEEQSHRTDVTHFQDLL